MSARVGQAYVYIFLDSEGDPIYIGSTRNLRRRVREHRRAKWAGESVRWIAFPYSTIDAALADESRLISLALPRHNRQGRKSGPSWLSLGLGLLSGEMPSDDDMRLSALLYEAAKAA